MPVQGDFLLGTLRGFRTSRDEAAVFGGVGRVGCPCRSPRRGRGRRLRRGGQGGLSVPKSPKGTRPPSSAGWAGWVVRAEVPEGDGLRWRSCLRPARSRPGRGG